MTNHAQTAIFAAKHKHIWGRYAALRYIQRKGVPVGLYRLACQLQAAQQVCDVPSMIFKPQAL